jgi:sec-independent protein translocase protein TatC
VPVVRPIGHQDRLSIVDHLDELRSRLFVVIAVFVVAFGVCYWQNHAILKIVNQPLVDSQQPGKGDDPLEQAARYQRSAGAADAALAPALERAGAALGALAGERGTSAATRAQAQAAQEALADAARAARRAAVQTPEATGRRPVTLGVAEPFVTTFTVAGWAALLLTMPVLLYQAYAFILPAFSPSERRIALPLMLMVPVLFVCGVLFGYFVALPRAVDFLQNFNDDQFDILIQARDYYRFVILFLGIMGLVFQIPVGVLALTRTGIVTARLLWKRQGYVILGISVLAAVATPTPDPVTMIVTMLPLVILYYLSIGLAWIFRPRGGSVVGRWEEWWEEEAGVPDEDEADEDAFVETEDEAAGGGAAASGATGDRTPLS